MKNKAPLALMEQLVMVLVFALAAVLCLQVFVFADGLSRTCEARDRAVLAAQNTAETLKHCAGKYDRAAELLGGEWDGEAWVQYRDETWQEAEENAAYQIRTAPSAEEESLLGCADITVSNREGNVLFTLSVAWQEVDGDE